MEVVQGETRKEYDLSAADKFWQENKGKPFPEVGLSFPREARGQGRGGLGQVAEAVQEELETYRSSEEEIRALKSAMGLDADSAEAVTLVADTTSKLTSTVSSLPELLEKKRLIDEHMNLATAILDAVKARRIDQFFQMEESLLQRSAGQRSALKDLLADPDAGAAQDKLRLLFQDLMLAAGPEPADLAALLTAIGPELAADAAPTLKFLKLWKSLHAHQTAKGEPLPLMDPTSG